MKMAKKRFFSQWVATSPRGSWFTLFVELIHIVSILSFKQLVLLATDAISCSGNVIGSQQKVLPDLHLGGNMGG